MYQEKNSIAKAGASLPLTFLLTRVLPLRGARLVPKKHRFVRQSLPEFAFNSVLFVGFGENFCAAGET